MNPEPEPAPEPAGELSLTEDLVQAIEGLLTALGRATEGCKSGLTRDAVARARQSIRRARAEVPT